MLVFAQMQERQDEPEKQVAFWRSAKLLTEAVVSELLLRSSIEYRAASLAHPYQGEGPASDTCSLFYITRNLCNTSIIINLRVAILNSLFLYIFYNSFI